MPAPRRFGLEVTGWNYAIIGLPDSGAHSPPKTYGSAALQPNQTARGLVHVRVHGGRQGDEGTVNLKVTSRGQEVDSVDAKVKVKDYEVELTASDVYLTEANKPENSRFKIKITGPNQPPNLRVTMTIQPPAAPKDALTLKWPPPVSGMVLTQDIAVGGQGFSSVIVVSAADLAVIPKIGGEGLVVTVSAVLPVDVDNPASTTFRVWQSTKNKLLLETREKPYIYSGGEIGVLDVRAVAGDRSHQIRNVELVVTNGEVTMDLNNPFLKTLPPLRPLSLPVGIEPLNCYTWKVYYRHAPTAGAPALAPIKFVATWRDTTETLSQDVRAFKIKAVNPGAVVATINKTATATLVDKRAGADIRWSLSLANDHEAVVGGQAMAAIDQREGNLQLLLDGGRSAAAYKVKAQLFKDVDENGEDEASVSDSKPFKAIWGDFDGDRYAGVIPEDGAIVVETLKSKAFILNLQGAGRVKVEVSHKDLVLIDAETKKPIPATVEAATRRTCIIQHQGSTGREGAPFGTIKLTLDEGERAQVLKIDVYVFDPIRNAVELVAVSAKDCPVGALPTNWDDRIVADMNTSWNQQAVIYVSKLKTSSFTTSVPVAKTGWTEKDERSLNSEYGRSPGSVASVYQLGAYASDRTEDGRGGAGAIWLKHDWSTNTPAHELGHALTIGFPHSERTNALMREIGGDDDRRLYISEIIQARRIATRSRDETILVTRPQSGEKFDRGVSIPFSCTLNGFAGELPAAVNVTLSGPGGRLSREVLREGATSRYGGEIRTVSLSAGEWTLVASAGWAVSNPVTISMVDSKIQITQLINGSRFKTTDTVACQCRVTGGVTPPASVAWRLKGIKADGTVGVIDHATGTPSASDPAVYTGILKFHRARPGPATIEVEAHGAQQESVSVQVISP